MIKLGQNNGFEVWFCCQTQQYTVYLDGVAIITEKYRFSDVKCYIE